MKQPQIYFAPMEGITTKTYRMVHREVYTGIDKYYSPFISVTGNLAMKKSDKNGVLPYTEGLVPQLLTNNSEAFVWGAKHLAEEGYTEINLNAGCPSATVVTKGKGAGLLSDLYKFENFLDGIFSAEGLPNISLKIRAGFESTVECESLANVISKFPFCEVIIHPRAREDFYKGKPDLKAFDLMADKLSCPVCYNGDLRTPEDVQRLLKDRSNIERIMIGRGLIAAPGLVEEIRTGEKDTKLPLFMKRLEEEYVKILSGDRDVLFKLKEVWGYIGQNMSGFEKELKAVKKSASLSQYDIACEKLLKSFS